MSQIRALHFASSFMGGAGTAARRIVEGQRIFGLDSYIIASSHGQPGLARHETALKLSSSQRLKSKSLTLIQSLLIQKSRQLVTPLSLSSLRVLETLTRSYDIINIHAMYNILTSSDLKVLSRVIPTVVTLHDQRLFTGGCHYSSECQGYRFNCVACPQVRRGVQFLPARILSRSVEDFRHSSDLQIVCPSQWLKKECQASRVLAEANVVVIPNPIPFDTLQDAPIQTEEGRSETLNIGFISKNLHNPYKGLDTLLLAVEHVSKSRSVVLRLFGDGPAPRLSGRFPVVLTGFQDSDGRTKAIISCDVIVVPSTQDNFPSVVGEALVLGVPVVSTKAGGLAELAEEFDFPTFDSGDWRQLAKLLHNYEVRSLNPKTVANARQRFSLRQCGESYARVYMSLMNGVKSR